ncbi:MAG TPA: hypothetical protein VGF08_09025, partial [Terriglobales bacterium]
MYTRSLMIAFVAVCVIPLFAQTSSDFPSDQILNRIHPEEIRAHMQFLADDLLEGRGTGTRGYMLAANYVRSQFQTMGLKPAGVDDYFQPVKFRRIELDAAHSSVAVKNGGKEQ